MTEEKLTKEELFKENPEQFIHLSELVIAVKKELDDPHKISVFIGEQSEFRLCGAMGLLKSKIAQLFKDMEEQKKLDNKITNELIKSTNHKDFRSFIGKKK